MTVINNADHVVTQTRYLVIDRVHQTLVALVLVFWVHRFHLIGQNCSPSVVDDRIFGAVTLQHRRVCVADGCLE